MAKKDDKEQSKKKDSLKNRLLSFEKTNTSKLNLEEDDLDAFDSAFNETPESESKEEKKEEGEAIQFEESDEAKNEEESPDDDVIEIELSNASIDDFNSVLEQYDQKTGDEQESESSETEGIDITSSSESDIDNGEEEEINIGLEIEEVDISVGNVLEEYDAKTTADSFSSAPEVEESDSEGIGVDFPPPAEEDVDIVEEPAPEISEMEEEGDIEEEKDATSGKTEEITSITSRTPKKTDRKKREIRRKKEHQAVISDFPEERIEELKNFFIIIVNKYLQIAQTYEKKKRDETKHKVKLSSDEDYEKMMWEGKNEEPPSSFSLFFSLKALKLFEIKSEIEKAFKGRYEDQRKVLLLTQKISKLMDMVSGKEKEEFKESLLQPLTSIVLVRGIGYLNIMLDKIQKLKDSVNAFDFVRTTITIQNAQKKDISLTKEFELISYICLLLSEIREKQDDKTENAINSLFRGRGARKTNFASYTQGSPIEKILDTMTDLDVEKNLPHLLWARNSLRNLNIEEKATFLRHFATGLKTIRDTLWSFFDRIEIGTLSLKQTYLDKFIDNFQNVPIQYWQLIGNKKIEDSIFELFSATLQHSQFYLTHLLPIICDISKPQDIENWEIFNIILKTLQKTDSEDKLILSAINRYLSEKSIANISLEEHQNGLTETMINALSNTHEELERAKQYIREKEETLLLREFIMITKLDKLDPPALTKNYLEPLMEYIENVDDPVDELYLITKLLKQKWRNADKRLRILLEIGEYIEEEFTFLDLKKSVSKKDLKEGVANAFLEIIDALENETVEKFLWKDQYSKDSQSMLEDLLHQFCNHLKPAEDLANLTKQIQESDEGHKLLLLEITKQTEIALEDEIQQVKSYAMEQARKICMEIALMMEERYQTQFVGKNLVSLVASSLPPDKLVERLVIVHEAVKLIKSDKLIQRFLEFIAPAAVQTYYDDLEFLAQNLNWAATIYQESPSSMDILHIVEQEIQKEFNVTDMKLKQVPDIVDRLYDVLGFQSNEMNFFTHSLKKLMIKISELEMHWILDEIYIHRKSVSEKGIELGSLNDAFIADALPQIIQTIYLHPQIIYFFQDALEVTNYLKLIKEIIYAESLSSESGTPTPARNQPTESVLIVLFKNVFPAIVEASEGILKTTQQLLDVIFDSFRKEIITESQRLLFLKNCAKNLREYTLHKNLKAVYDNLREEKDSIPNSDTLLNLLALSMPYNERMEASSRLSKLKENMETEKERIVTKQYVNSELQNKIREMFGDFIFKERDQQETSRLLTEILFLLFSPKEAKRKIERLDEKNDYFFEWKKFISGKPELVRWFRRMEDGTITSEIDWMYNTAWYRDITQNYWSRKSSSKIKGLFKSLVKDFEKLDNKREILKHYFREWEKESLGFVGKLLFRALVYRDGPIGPLKLIYDKMSQIKPYELGNQNIRELFIKKATNIMKNLEDAAITYKPKAEKKGKSLEESFETNLIKKLNEKTLQHFTNDLLKKMPEEVQEKTKSRLTRRMKLIPKPPETSGETHLDRVIDFLIDHSTTFLFVEIGISSINNEKIERLLRSKYSKISSIYSNYTIDKPAVYDATVLLNSVVDDLKYIEAHKGSFAKKDAIYIKEKLPAYYFKYFDYITTILDWITDPQAELLVETIDSSPSLQDALKENEDILRLIVRNQDKSELIGVLKNNSEEIAKLKGQLKKMLRGK